MANNTDFEEPRNFGYDTTNNLPTINYIKNNRGSSDIICMNFIYMLHNKSAKNSWNYLCRFKGCGASISLKIGTMDSGRIEPLIPFVPTYLQINHKGHEVIQTINT